MPARLNPDASSSRKMLELYTLLLFSGRQYTLTNLSKRLQCSKTTIERLVGEIELFDNVELGKEGKERLYQIKRLCKNKQIQMMFENIQQISLCKDLASCVLSEEFREEIQKTVNHTAGMISDDNMKKMSLEPIARSSAKGMIDYTPFQPIITLIMQAIPKKIVCEVTYRSPKSDSARQFTIAPMRLLSYQNAMYVECWRLKQDDNKDTVQPMTLAIHRIEALNPTRKRHKFIDPPKNGDGCFGLIKSKRIKLIIRFDKEVSAYVSERIWSSDQTITALPSGDVELEFTANSVEELIAWVLSFGDKAEIVEPIGVRELIKNVLSQSLKIYQNSFENEN